MIYTVTLNPALDYWMAAGACEMGEVNRATGAGFSFGGKGLNVSATLHKLGTDSTALGFAAGWTGDALLQYARAAGIRTDFVCSCSASALTRINVKLRGQETTEINAPGYAPTKEDMDQLMRRLEQVSTGDTVVLAGSLPPKTRESLYAEMIGFLKEKGARVVVDCAGEALRWAVLARPFLVKPNRNELEDFVKKTLSTEEDVLHAARLMQQAGAKRVLVSLGGDGALFLDAAGAAYRAPALQGDVLQTVGAGDAMLAGFLYGYTVSEGDVTEALRWGTCAGAAAVFYGNAATGENVHGLYAGTDIRVERPDTRGTAEHP